MKVYGPEKAHLVPQVKERLQQHVREDIKAGIYDAYSALIDLVVSSSLFHGCDDVERAVNFFPSGGLEYPLLARFGLHAEPSKFRLTLSRVDPDTLDSIDHSTLTVATVKPVNQYDDLGETFTLPQIQLAARHAYEIISIDGIIGTFGITRDPVEPGSAD